MKLSEKYYTGREVQRKLGITEPALRNLVNQRKIKKIIPPGRTYGVYLKTEIDRFAEKWEAFLMAEEPPKTIFRIARSEDMTAEQDLDHRSVGTIGMPAEVKRAWLAVNGESDYHVYHDNKLVAFLFLVPIRHEIIDAFMQGTIHWRDIDPQKDIETYAPGKPLDVFVQGIGSEPDVDETTRMHYMLVLLRGAAEELKKLGRRGVVIKKLYARSQSPTGIAMAIHTGMQEYKPMPRTGKLVRFELDIETSHAYLAQAYKEGFEEWKKEQKKQTTHKRSASTRKGQASLEEKVSTRS